MLVGGKSRFRTSHNLFQSCALLKYDMKSNNKSLSGSMLEKAGKSRKYCYVFAAVEIST